MIGDHHGWTVRMATLLVTATDEILGTHSATTPAFSIAVVLKEPTAAGFIWRPPK